MSLIHTLENLNYWKQLVASYKAADNETIDRYILCLIKELDLVLSQQLSVIIQNPSFKKLEALWLSVLKTVIYANTAGNSHCTVKVKIIDFSWQDVVEDCNHLFDIRHSIFYHRLYRNELDTAGGEPLGMLLVDHQLSLIREDSTNVIDDLYAAEVLAEIGRECFCPVVFGVDHYVLGESSEELWFDPERLERILSSNDFSDWHHLRAKQSSSFLYLVQPEYKLRGGWSEPNIGFVFSEDNDQDQSTLWGNSVFLLARSVIQTFKHTGWFFFVNEEESFVDKELESISGPYGKAVSSDIEPRIYLFAEHDNVRIGSGIMSFSTLHLSDKLSLSAVPSAHKHSDNSDSFSSALDVTLMVCRFAHFIKSQIRRKIGHSSPDQAESELKAWLSQYVNASGYGTLRHRYPLKSFSLEVKPSPNNIADYNLFIQLTPHLNSEFINATVLLTTMIDQ